MTKPKKPPVMITCARRSAKIAKNESCSWRYGRSYFRVCQACAGKMLGLKP